MMNTDRVTSLGKRLQWLTLALLFATPVVIGFVLFTMGPAGMVSVPDRSL